MTHIACESPPRVASPSNSSTHAQQLHTYSHLHTEHTTSIPASPTTSLTHIVPPLHLIQAVSLPCHLTTPHPQLLLQPPLKSPPHPYPPTSMSLRASSSLATSVCPPCTHQCCYHHQHLIHGRVHAPHVVIPDLHAEDHAASSSLHLNHRFITSHAAIFELPLMLTAAMANGHISHTLTFSAIIKAVLPWLSVAFTCTHTHRTFIT